MTITDEDVYTVAPFAKTLGVRFRSIEPDAVSADLPYSRDQSTVGAALHGGALMGLADVVGAVCAVANGAGSVVPATMDSTTTFLRPVRGAGASAVARPLHIGRSTVAVEIDIRDDADRLCVRVTQRVALRRADA
ncbi:PaaI family thioesterase [Streptomyces sp. NPDC049936]|uniref:PaaI family thioesterase n=1 Tax=Streptomyces sp. NPDC049936 TaxID=3365599 RepID=UPI0037BAB386